MKIITMLQDSNLLIMSHKSNIPVLINYTWSKNYSLIKWAILNKWNLKIIGIFFLEAVTIIVIRKEIKHRHEAGLNCCWHRAGDYLRQWLSEFSAKSQLLTVLLSSHMIFLTATYSFHCSSEETEQTWEKK